MQGIPIGTICDSRGWCSACGGYSPTIEFVVHRQKHTETVDVRCARHLTTLFTYERPRTRE